MSHQCREFTLTCFFRPSTSTDTHGTKRIHTHSYTGLISLTHTHSHTHTHNVSHTDAHMTTKLPKTSTALPLCLGGPGSGKGTQSLKIAERYGFQYMSVGELLRKKMIHNATSNRKWSLIAKIITNGELAPQVTEKLRGRHVSGGGGEMDKIFEEG